MYDHVWSYIIVFNNIWSYRLRHSVKWWSDVANVTARIIQHLMYACIQHLIHVWLQHFIYSRIQHLVHLWKHYLIYPWVHHLIYAWMQHFIYVRIQHFIMCKCVYIYIYAYMHSSFLLFCLYPSSFKDSTTTLPHYAGTSPYGCKHEYQEVRC